MTTDTEYRHPPANIEAEQALLGALLVNNRAYEQVSEFLIADHFTDPLHGRIFDAIGKQLERGQEANPTTLQFYFENDEAIEEVGGRRNYLNRLAASAVTVINARDYGNTIHDLFVRQQLIFLGEDTVNEAYDPDLSKSVGDLIEITEARLFQISTANAYDTDVRPVSYFVSQAIDEIDVARRAQGVTGVPSGFVDLDQLLGGFYDSDLIILAGRPSMGKTALATNIAFNVADSIGPSVIFSLEMSGTQLAMREISTRTGISSHALRAGRTSNEDFSRAYEASQEIKSSPVFIDDSAGLSIERMRSRARRLRRHDNIRLIIIDYLQLMTSSGENRTQEISTITRGLKGLAKEIGVPVIALSQLSRQVEMRDDKRPRLSDLRESGSIEQDADVVAFIFREEYYLQQEEPKQKGSENAEKFNERHTTWELRMEKNANVANVIIAKQRHGPVGSIDLRFDPVTTKFTSLDKNHGQPDQGEF